MCSSDIQLGQPLLDCFLVGAGGWGGGGALDAAGYYTTGIEGAQGGGRSPSPDLQSLPSGLDRGSEMHETLTLYCNSEGSQPAGHSRRDSMLELPLLSHPGLSDSTPLYAVPGSPMPAHASSCGPMPAHEGPDNPLPATAGLWDLMQANVGSWSPVQALGPQTTLPAPYSSDSISSLDLLGLLESLDCVDAGIQEWVPLAAVPGEVLVQGEAQGETAEGAGAGAGAESLLLGCGKTLSPDFIAHACCPWQLFKVQWGAFGSSDCGNGTSAETLQGHCCRVLSDMHANFAMHLNSGLPSIFATQLGMRGQHIALCAWIAHTYVAT